MIAATFTTFLAIVPAFAHPTEATCAWVLWQNTTGVYRGALTIPSWEIKQAFESKEACEAKRSTEFRTFALVTPVEGTKKAVHDGAVTFTSADSESTTRFLCLPDTIDPRGPKGGGR